MPWDDFKYLLAIARARGLPGAAEALDVTMSTVYRRLEKIEQRYGGALFHRAKAGYEPNDICLELLATAEKMESEVFKAERTVESRDRALVGTVRITATEVLAPFFIARHIPEIRTNHPGLEFEIISANQMLSLSEREADIAFRPVRPDDGDLFGRKISDISWGIYGAKTRRKSQPEFNDLAAISTGEFVGIGGNRMDRVALLDQRTRLEDVEIRLFTNSLISMASAAAAGTEYALLPCLLGEQWPTLKCFAAPIHHQYGELWIVCHRDLRRNARVRAVFDFFIAAAIKDKSLFLGPK